MDLIPADQVLDSCTFRDEDDDCTYHYTVENPKDKDLEVQVLKKKGERHVPFLGMAIVYLGIQHLNMYEMGLR